jgi:hypothetical protein
MNRMYEASHDSGIFNPTAGYRLPPHLHGRHDHVDISVRDLGTERAWPLIIDEAMRLISSKGTIRFAFFDPQYCEFFELASFLENCSDGGVRLKDIQLGNGEKYEPSQKPKHRLVTIEVERPNQDRTTDDVSFAIISGGQNFDLLRNQILSIDRITRTATQAAEILVCGPKSVNEQLAEITPECQTIVASEISHVSEDFRFAAHPWITGKKNKLVASCKYPNIVLTHERYRFPSTFHSDLALWGGDYSILVPKAITTDGQRYPDWIAQERPWRLGHNGLVEYSDYHPGMFNNGGIFVAKTALLKDHSFSEILFWHEAEDVELSRRLYNHGICLRIAPSISVISSETTPAYKDGFVPLEPSADSYASWPRVVSANKTALKRIKLLQTSESSSIVPSLRGPAFATRVNASLRVRTIQADSHDDCKTQQSLLLSWHESLSAQINHVIDDPGEPQKLTEVILELSAPAGTRGPNSAMLDGVHCDLVQLPNLHDPQRMTLLISSTRPANQEFSNGLNPEALTTIRVITLEFYTAFPCAISSFTNLEKPSVLVVSPTGLTEVPSLIDRNDLVIRPLTGWWDAEPRADDTTVMWSGAQTATFLVSVSNRHEESPVIELIAPSRDTGSFKVSIDFGEDDSQDYEITGGESIRVPTPLQLEPDTHACTRLVTLKNHRLFFPALTESSVYDDRALGVGIRVVK